MRDQADRFELYIKLSDGIEQFEMKGQDKWSLFDVGYDILKNNEQCVEAWVIDTHQNVRIDIDGE